MPKYYRFRARTPTRKSKRKDRDGEVERFVFETFFLIWFALQACKYAASYKTNFVPHFTYLYIIEVN